MTKSAIMSNIYWIDIETSFTVLPVVRRIEANNKGGGTKSYKRRDE